MVVADRFHGGEEFAQPALGHFGGVERLDEGAGAHLAAAHRLADRGKHHRHDLGIAIGHEAGVDEAGARPEIGRRLDADDADGAALQVLDGLDGTVVLHHVGGLEIFLAGGLEADVRHDRHVQALCAGEDHRESGRGAGVELAGEEGLEALGVRLEEDLLELVALALVRREIGARAHQPHLLLGGEAAAEADEGRFGCLRAEGDSE